MFEMHASESLPGAPRTLISAHDADTLNRLVILRPALALRQALPLVRQLAGEYVRSLSGELPVTMMADPARGPQVVGQVAGHEGAWWLGYFFWVPGAATPIHDHTSWAAYACACGTLLEERYRRLDNYAHPSRAHLRVRGQQQLGAGDCSALLADADGIHRIANRGVAPAWSVHLYGPRFGQREGRDYDPARDYVCDRRA
jgi:predicted metal-dependent enzyme (double-stranded beta helix superfamily)